MIYLNISADSLTYIILAIAIVPIIILMVYAIIVALRRSNQRNEQREKEIGESTDESQIELFTTVYGGKENILDVNRELGRISVTVEDVEKVDLERLQELGANGVLVMGKIVKSSFADRASYIYKILAGDEKNE